MSKKILLVLLISMVVSTAYSTSSEENTDQGQCQESTWVVVGAGPAGIVVTALLLDIGIPAEHICMIDPVFHVGDLSLYANVPANTKNKLWIEFLSSFKCMQNVKHPSFDAIYHVYDPEKEYPLSTIIEPLQVMSDYLTSRVSFVKDKITALYTRDNKWRIGFSTGEMVASHVVLATGSHPKKINGLAGGEKDIPLVDALDKHRLATVVTGDDCVAVFGSAHSAILILKHLSEIGVHEIINFYTKPLAYTVELESGYLNISSGLKGATAEWARTVLEKNPPANLKRVLSNQENIAHYIPQCTKIIHAIGFERNELPYNNNHVHYDDLTGTIAPRLFGIGIAFPQLYVDPHGNQEHRVGINSFLEYALAVVPAWARAKHAKDMMSRIAAYEELFEVIEL